MSGIQELLLGNFSTGSYQIERSLRFNSADSAYLNRTPASAGNRRTWTWSAWTKITPASTARFFAARVDDNNRFIIALPNTQNNLQVSNVISGTSTVWAATNALLRDPSAWYHIVVAFDSPQATATNRLKVYLNGVEQTFSTDNRSSITQNYDGYVNNNIAHYIGTATTGAGNFSDKYLTEVNFIDGQALTPSSFGETDAQTGVWKPKAYTGTYGTNGFFLKFADNSNTTAATLGKDSSGNGNNWTPNNFSVTAGVGNDSLVDTPTSYGTDTGVGGEVRGNYCTFNQLINGLNYNSGSSIVNGNLQATSTTGSTYKSAFSNIGVSSGKWYFEFTWTAIGGSAGGYVGISTDPQAVLRDATYPFVGTTSTSWGYRNYDGQLQTNDAATAYGNSYATNDVIGVALDMDNGKVWFSKNNTWQNSGSPTGGTNAAVTGLTGTMFVGASYYDSGDSVYLNAGQRPFAYTAPSGFKALCTQNLPTPTIGATSTTQANDYFDATTYTGTGATQSITNSGSMQPDFVWIKSRSAATSNGLFDAVRGTNKALYSNLTAAEDTYTNTLNSFNSNGFTLGADTTWGGVNTNAATYVAWQWNAGGSNATNTSGTITSTVRANTTAGFSIVTYTGNGSAGTVGHGLGVAPSMVIIKSRSDADSSWIVYHSSISPTNLLTLQTTAAQQNLPLYFNSTATASTVFSIGSSANTGVDLNVSTKNYVAYCFAAVAGYSAFGSYTGNGSSDGPFVYTGFRPRYLLIKCYNQTANWQILDTATNTYNAADKFLRANSSIAESTNYPVDILSNGFKLRNTDGDYNASASYSYIYAAFAENPFKYSLAR